MLSSKVLQISEKLDIIDNSRNFILSAELAAYFHPGCERTWFNNGQFRHMYSKVICAMGLVVFIGAA